MTTKPFSFQIKDAKKIARFGGRSLLANEMGLGKSLISLLYAHEHPKLRPIVIVCPASLKWNWENECAKHFGMRAEVLEGIKPGRNSMLVRPQIVIINYTILYAWIEQLRELEPKLVIIDECHALQSLRTRQTKSVRALCQGVPHVVALSGTPLTNRPAELWPTLNLLRPDLFPSFWSYAMKFCAPKRVPWGSGWEFKGASNLSELHETLIESLMIRRRKVDVLKDLPAKQRSVVPLSLSDPKEYRDAFQDFLGWLAKRNPSKLKKAEKAERLVRMGYLKRLAAKLKLPAVFEWIDSFLEESDGKLVLFAVHKSVISALRERYNNLCVVVDGSTIGRQRQLAVEQFQTKDKTRLFIGNVKAAGVGLNLTAASTVCFAELAWTPGLHAQAEDRCHRIGSKGNVSVYYLVARDTVETNLVELIQEKARTLDAVLDNGNVQDEMDIFDRLTEQMLKEKRK